MAAAPSHFLADMLTPWARVTIKRMFGGMGAWRGGLFFALIVDDAIYFKVDDTNRPAYESALSAPFTYTKTAKNGVTQTKYLNGLWRVPDEVIEDADELVLWAQAAYEVALIASRKKARTKTSLPDLKGLGVKSQSRLKAIGINHRKDLEKCGAIEAYKQLKARYPADVSLNLLWALYALLYDMELTAVTAEIKEHLKALLSAIPSKD